MFSTKIKSLITHGTLGILALSSLVFTTTLADDYMYVKATHLNIRAAGTFRSAIVATVDNGYKVTVLGSEENGWKKVLLENGAEGYVNGRYLTEQEPYFEKVLGTTYNISVPQAFLRGDDLVKKVAVLHKGDELTILDEKVFLGKWIRVRVVSSIHGRYNERTGYISKKLVEINEESLYEPMNSAPAEDTSSTDSSWISGDESVVLNSAPAEDTGATSKTTENTQESASESSDDADLSNLLGGLLK